MIGKDALLADLKVQVRALEDDLRERSKEVTGFDSALRKEWQSARDAKRTAAAYESWLDGEITQSAVAWVLGTIFLRFCEDNALIDLPYLAGPGERLVIATERQQAFFEMPENREKTDREWITEGFAAIVTASPVTAVATLFDGLYKPMERINPSLEAAKALINFWRRRDTPGEIIHDFTDVSWSTHFLGDLYQDLSDQAKKTYALLQTPEFVEEFILDLTLDPAVGEFGLDPDPPNSPVDLPKGLRLIDPTCGSGHFLLGAFHRLLAKWQLQAPGADRWDLIHRVLYSVHGVDKNSFAVAIARFRLLVAAMRAGEVKRLTDTPDFTINIAIGDSLIHGRGAPGVQTDLLAENGAFTYITEDIAGFKSVDLLGVNTYHVVVGNPPYITVKDMAESAQYRSRYKTCAGTYALSVPFAERFFNLASVGSGDRRGAGFVGLLTANSFMKREFGKKLIENLFRLSVNLTHVIDTSGAFIPGHGTPTVILIGRNIKPTAPTCVRAALGIRGEPKQPEIPALGHVWRAIDGQIKTPNDSESEWISVVELPRDRLSTHPWSLSGGGAADLLDDLNAAGTRKLEALVKRIGFYGDTHADEAFSFPLQGRLGRRGALLHGVISYRGDQIRDWSKEEANVLIFPYSEDKVLLDEETLSPLLMKMLWPLRSLLWTRTTFSGTYRSDGRAWYEWHQLPKDIGSSGSSIAFAFVATHNHFVFDRDGIAFNRSAPVIKLPEKTSEADHLELLAILNSSTACFWFKQVCHDKGNRGEGGGITSSGWERFHEFAGTRLQEFPLPWELPLVLGRGLDAIAQGVAAAEPSAVTAEGVPTRSRLDAARYERTFLRGRMIALQEELDWEVYRLYGLLSDQEATELRADQESAPDLKLGERAFEIMLAREMASGEIETQWFARHGSTPITEVPGHWPKTYKRVVEKRIETIERRRDIALIERPEYKRRWQSEPWEKKEKTALRNWLLDRCEERDLWFAADDMGNLQPRPMTVNRLADRLRGDADFVSVARLYAGADAELADVLTEIIDAEHVPHLAALRYKDPGLRKRAQWESVWDLQREEDATGERLDTPVPPKYASADFRKTPYWRNRGKLDVPKERFISYPGASPDGDGSLLLGWAGWDHREQAHALMMLIEERTSRDGWRADRLTPLIAGLAEVLPWVRQWHGEVDPMFGVSPAEAYEGYLEDQQRRHALTADDLRNWRPPSNGRGGKPRAKKATSASSRRDEMT